MHWPRPVVHPSFQNFKDALVSHGVRVVQHDDEVGLKLLDFVAEGIGQEARRRVLSGMSQLRGFWGSLGEDRSQRSDDIAEKFAWAVLPRAQCQPRGRDGDDAGSSCGCHLLDPRANERGFSEPCRSNDCRQISACQTGIQHRQKARSSNQIPCHSRPVKLGRQQDIGAPCVIHFVLGVATTLHSR